MGNNLPEIPFGWRQRYLYVNQPRRYTDWLRSQYGDLVNLRTSTADFILTMTSEGAREVLTADPSGYSAMWKEGFGGVAGTGSLWVLDGEAHRQERLLLSPSFHARLFRTFGEDIREVTRIHTEAWKPGEEIQALQTTLKISLDVIMRLVFGVKDGPAIVEGRHVVTDLWRKMHPITVFFPKLQASWFPVWRRYQQARTNFTDFVMRRLAERRAQGSKEGGEDLLGRMLAARYEDGRAMRDEEIRDELITILLAGHETTATALSWALYELGRHPEIMARLRQEIATLGPDPDPGSIVKLPFLGVVCDETMRLHTLLPEIARVLAAPTNLFGKQLGAEGSREVGIGISVMAIHHDANLYPEPDRFRPERFMERSFTPFEFLPFGGGHRRCLGAGLSDFEMRIALATIAMRWDVEPVEEEKEIRHDIAMGPKNGVRLRVAGRLEPSFASNGARPAQSAEEKHPYAVT